MKGGKFQGDPSEPTPRPVDPANPDASRGYNLSYAHYLASDFSQTESGSKITAPDPLPTGGEIRGIVTARDGIHPGYPQIMFWEDTGADPDPLDETMWKPAELNARDRGKTLTAKEFRYTLIDSTKHLYNDVPADNGETVKVAVLDTYNTTDNLDFAKTYKFRLRVMDTAGRMHYYPPDDDPASGSGYGDGAAEHVIDGFRGGDGGVDWVSRPGKNPITLSLTAPTEKPVIEAVPLPYDVGTYNAGGKTMSTLPSTAVPADEYHVYVNTGSASYKHGDFIFQVLTSHTGAIDSAELTFDYYEFPVNDVIKYQGGLSFDTLAGADATGGLVITLPRPPVSEGTVYQFTSSTGFATITGPGSAGHGTSVRPGMYKFHVRATSSGSVQTRTFTIYVDKTDPGIQINVIEGAVQEPDVIVGSESGINFYKVNGHIKVRLIAYENETLLRNHSADDRKEQKWFVSPEPPLFFGLSHGDRKFPVAGSSFDPAGLNYFDSSTIVLDTRAIWNNAVANTGAQGEYYLYMFDRDAAFNAGYKYIKLSIDQLKDKPVIDPGDLKPGLSGPAALLEPANASNRLGPGDLISLKLEDDDGLLLSNDLVFPGHSEWTAEGQTTVKIARESGDSGNHGVLKDMPIDTIRRIFKTNEEYRIPGTNTLGMRKEQDVQISLADLHSAITGNKDEIAPLPDGKYYLEITVRDHSGIKYWITQPADDVPPSPDLPVAAASSTLATWIAVDTSGPLPLPDTFEPAGGSRAKNGSLTASGFPNGYIEITGIVSDANELATLEILPPYKSKASPPYWEAANPAADYAPITDITAQPHNPGEVYEYRFTVKADVDLGPDTAEESERVFLFRATDKFGNAETFELELRVDKVKPVVSLLKYIGTTDIGGRPAANGIIEFVVGLVEENPGEIRYWLSSSAGETPLEAEAPKTTDWSTGTLIPKNNWYDPGHGSQTSYTWRIDTTGLSPGWYQLYVMAQDQARNFSIDDADNFATLTLGRLKLQTIYIDQDSDAPRFSQIRPNGHFVGDNTLKISGRVDDDDGFTDNAKVKVSFTWDGGLTWTAPVDAGTNERGNQNKTISFTHTIPQPPDQKTFQYRVTVSDDPAKKLPNDTASWTKIPAAGYTAMPAGSSAAKTGEGIYAFTYDKQPPLLYFDTKLQFDQPFSELPPYIYVGVVENRLNPLVPTVQNPVPGLSYNYENTGEAASPPGTPVGIGTHITKVAWTQAEMDADASGETIYVTAETVAGSSPMTLKAAHPANLTVYRIPRGLLNAKKAWASLADGSYNIQFPAVDEAGNSSRTNFGFYKDTAPPALGFTDIVDTLDYTSLTASGPISSLGFTGTAAPKLGGTFNDRYTPLRNEIPAGETFRYHLYNVVHNANISAGGFDPDDYPTQFVELTPTGGISLPLDLPAGYTWADTDKGKSMPWLIELRAGPVAASDSERGTKWRQGLTEGEPIPDGLHLLTLEVRDLNGNETTYQKVLFRTDHEAPAITVDRPLQENAVYTVSAYSPFTIEGTAADANLSGLSLRIGAGGAVRDLTVNGGDIVSTGITEAETSAGSGTYHKKVTWKYTVSAADLAAAGVTNGEVSVFMSAVDENGTSAEREWRFIADSTPVDVRFSSMEAGDTYLNSSTAQITGSAFDVNKVLRLESYIQEWDYTAVTPPGQKEPGNWGAAAEGWTTLFSTAVDGDSDGMADSFSAAAQNRAWEKKFGAGGLALAEGKYRIKIRSRDFSRGTGDSDSSFGATAGHYGETAWKVFHINPLEPELKPDNESPYIKGSGTTVTLTGTVEDANRIKQVRAWASGGSSSPAIHYWPLDAADSVNSDNAVSKTYTITLSDLDTSSAIEVHLAADDWSGRTGTKTLTFTIDNTVPTLQVLYPEESGPLSAAPFERLMGRDTIRGTGADNYGLSSLEYQLGWTAIGGSVWSSGNIPDIVNWSSTSYSWSLTFPDISKLVSGSDNQWVKKANPAGSDPILGNGGVLSGANPLDQNIWVLPVKLKLIDLAGNETIQLRYYWVDPVGDKPRITIDSPRADGIVGGAITVTGKAEDSHGRVENVVYRVLDTSANPKTLAEPVSQFPADTYSNSAALTGEDGVNYTNTGAWRLATISGGIRSALVQWNFKINTTGDLDPTANQPNPIYIEVMAWDSAQDPDTGAYTGPTAIPDGGDAANTESARRKQNGWVKRIKVTVESGVPVFQTVQVYRGGAPGTIADTAKGLKGTVYVEATVTDDQGLDSISYLSTAGTMTRINLDPGASPAPATGPGSWDAPWAYKAYGPSDGGNPYSGFHVYKIHVPVNLDTLAAAPNGSSLFNFELLALDMSVPAHHPRTYTVPLQADYFAPLGEYTGNSNAIGTHYLLQGRIWDREGGAAQGGNQRVEVWVKDGAGKFYVATASGGIPVEIGAGASVPAYVGRYADGGGGVAEVAGAYGLAAFGDGRHTVPRPSAYITIDRNILTPDGEHPYLTGWYPDGIYHEWTAEINTATLPAGALRACFLVYDDAGNATYYEHPLIIRDGGPLIRGVSLATDLYKNGTPALNEPAAAGKAAVINQEKAVSVNYENITGFTARNQLIHVRAMVEENSAAGFAPYTYGLSYLSGYGTTAPITGLVKDSYYEIVNADSGGFSSWESVGAPAGAEAGTIFKATGPASRGAGTARALVLSKTKTPVKTTGNFTDPETNLSWAVTTAAFTFPAADFGSGGIAHSSTIDEESPPGPDLDDRGHEKLKDHPRFVLDITDSKGISAFIVLAIPSLNIDSQRSTIRLYDFNPKHEIGREAAAATPGSLNAANPVLGSPAVNKERGGLYNTTGSVVNVQKSGHIEPRKNTGAPHGGTLPAGVLGTNNFARDVLSGEVILRGWAFDSRRVEKISLRFGGAGPAMDDVDILVWNPAAKKLIPTAAATRGGTALAYAQEVMNLTGHYVEWAFIWDTQDYPRAGSTSVVLFEELSLTALAWDLSAAPGYQSTAVLKTPGDTSGNGYNSIAVDLAPYISGLNRNFSTIKNLRSKLGYYGLNRGEAVTLTGFNLSKNAAGNNTALSIGGAAVDNAGKTPAAKTIVFTVPSSAVNGEVRLVSKSANTTAKDITAINSDARVYRDAAGRRTNSWNRENTAAWNADTWTDQRMARVWTSQDTDRFGGTNYTDTTGTAGIDGGSNAVSGTDVTKASEHGEHVSMTVNPADGKLFGAWAWNDFASVLWGTPNEWGKIMQQWTDPFDNTDIHFSTVPVSTTYQNRVSATGRPIVVYNAGGTSGGNLPTGITNKGGLYVFDLEGTDSDLSTNSEGIRRGYWVEKTHHGTGATDTVTYFKADRFRNPRIITRGDDIHVSYYDQITRSLKYWYGRNGVEGTSGIYRENAAVGSGFYAQRWVNLDGGFEQNDMRRNASTTYWDNYDRVRDYANRLSAGDQVPVVGNYYTDFATTQRAAGLWNAIALTTDNKPVIVYYAQSDQKLLYTSSSSAASVSGADWSAPAVVPGGGSTNYGEYVSARIDNSGYLHIAYFDRANSALMYVRSTTTAAPYSFGAPVEVDKTGAVGRWTDLSLDYYGNPWIVYEDIDRQGTADGVKAAWIPGLGAYDDTKYQSAANWETMNVPNRAKVEADTRVNIEHIPSDALKTSLGWQAAVGYQESGGGYFRTAKLLSGD
jgi:hypothetical protein